MGAGRYDRVTSATSTQEGSGCVPAGRARAHGYAECSDQALVLLTRAGEHAAFDALIARHQDRLYALALRSLGSEDAAGEALCGAAVAAYRNVGSQGAYETPATWLWLHGFREVFLRLKPSPGRYTVVSWPWDGAPSGTPD